MSNFFAFIVKVPLHIGYRFDCIDGAHSFDFGTAGPEGSLLIMTRSQMVDYLEMLPREVRHMWDTQRLTVPKALFFALRYYVFIHAGISGYCMSPLWSARRAYR